MTIYLDSSALVKRYSVEEGSEEVVRIMNQSDVIGTCIITRAEVAAAFAKGVRIAVTSKEDAFQDLQAFRKDWDDFVRLDLTETIVSRADNLAWDHQLRGYDAVHLASALVWQEALDESVVLATYDKQLWSAAKETGLEVFPNDLE